MRKWRIEDSEELYNITGWGTSYFGINDKGHVVVTPRKDGVGVDLKDLVDELQLRDVTARVSRWSYMKPSPVQPHSKKSLSIRKHGEMSPPSPRKS